jgi:hypothetical protein
MTIRQDKTQQTYDSQYNRKIPVYRKLTHEKIA